MNRPFHGPPSDFTTIDYTSNLLASLLYRDPITPDFSAHLQCFTSFQKVQGSKYLHTLLLKVQLYKYC